MKKINLKIEGKDKEYLLEENFFGIRLGDIVKEFCDEYKGYIIFVVVDNKLKELNCRVKKDCEINFLDIINEDGERVYFRVMLFIFVMVCREIFWDSRVIIEYLLLDGLYCEVYIDRKFKEVDVENIKNKMKEIVNNDYVIEKIEVIRNEVIFIFENNEMYEKVEFLKYKEYDSVKVYKCRNYIDYFYGYMLLLIGYIKLFDIKFYNGGVIILGFSEEDKIFFMKFVF